MRSGFPFAASHQITGPGRNSWLTSICPTICRLNPSNSSAGTHDSRCSRSPTLFDRKAREVLRGQGKTRDMYPSELFSASLVFRSRAIWMAYSSLVMG